MIVIVVSGLQMFFLEEFITLDIFLDIKHEITATYLPQHWNDVLHTSSRWGTDAVIKHGTHIKICC